MTGVRVRKFADLLGKEDSEILSEFKIHNRHSTTYQLLDFTTIIFICTSYLAFNKNITNFFVIV